ncbi:MAG TPA: urate hydroxylase PuuD [Blastocatellia bacterium]|nr:urate hydroxylase PuuD [Blastocatellia bacterium]
MLPAFILDLAVLPAQLAFFFKGVFTPPTNSVDYVQILLRLLHFLAGIIWIGHLYFFNLVNVNLMKALDGPTKGKVIPQLMPRTLWWFRWGALITVLVGLAYYAMYILKGDAGNAGKNVWVVLLVWILILVIAFAIEMVLVKRINNGWALAVALALLMMIMALVIIWWLKSQLADLGSNKSYSIGIGGGLGIVMLFNVWGIIWPNQKRIISWTADNAENGTAIPAESAKLGRVAFLASRTNTWLSVPMLFFMGASTHFNFLGV